MNRAIGIFLIMILPICGFSQTDSTSLLAHIDKVTNDWDNLSKELQNYNGLKKYCVNKSFNKRVVETLNNFHHYDTVIYNTLVKKQRYKKSKEIEHALNDIKKFEKNYSPKSLMSFLKEECSYRREIEKGKKDSKSNFGESSYDGQINLLEAELFKYIKHITKLADRIQKHSHQLHLEKYSDE